MSIQVSPQPDQQARLWDRHVSLYESVFEPVTSGLARKAIDALGLKPGARIIDSGAGAGGAALELARLGARVTAIDASLMKALKSGRFFLPMLIPIERYCVPLTSKLGPPLPGAAHYPS